MTDKEKQTKFMNMLNQVKLSLERYALSITRDSYEAKELVAETIAAAWEGFDTLKNDKAFLSFVFTIARRKNISKYRKNKRLDISDPEIFDDYSGVAISPDDQMDIKLMKEAIQKLKPEYKEALTLFEFSGMSHKEIAKIQGSSVGSVKLRIHRARKKLAKVLGVSDEKTKKTKKIEISIINLSLIVI